MIILTVYTFLLSAKSLQSCPTLCDPIDGSPPGSAIPGIPQARTLEWVAISFSNAWKWKVKMKSLSRDPMDCSPPGSSVHGIFQARVLEWVAFWLLPKLDLSSPMLTRNRERVLGEVKRCSFYCFARQRGPQWANALKTMWSTLEGVVRSFIVFKEQGVISSWTILGLLCLCLKVKFQASPTSLMGCILVVSSFHLAGGEGRCFL